MQGASDSETAISDIDPKMEEIQLAGLREMPGWRKLELVAELNEAVREFNLAGLKMRYPQDSETKLRRRLADLLLGEELAERFYGPLEP